MNTQETISEIARRLPFLHRRDVRDVIEVLVELWQAELTKPDGQVRLTGLGKLYVETHTLKASGIIRQKLLEKHGRAAPRTILRRVLRFSPSDKLLIAMKMSTDGETDDE
ncbi:MAG: HU family DNA-binding protein [Anaerolineae bacterium]|nr:HU family DNA-binding protein [Anaerolineae bacterium]